MGVEYRFALGVGGAVIRVFAGPADPSEVLADPRCLAGEVITLWNVGSAASRFGV